MVNVKDCPGTHIFMQIIIFDWLSWADATRRAVPGPCTPSALCGQAESTTRTWWAFFVPGSHCPLGSPWA